MRRSHALGLAVIVIFAACSTDNSDNSTSPAVTTRTTRTAAVDATTESARSDPLDLTQQPFVVFSPAGPLPDGSDLPIPHGSDDWYDLFLADAPWQVAAGRTNVFLLPSLAVRFYTTDADLIRLIEYLADRDIALGISMEPLEVPDPSECQPTESFEGSYDLALAQRIADLGGTIQFVAIDEPYAFAHKLDTAGACQRPVQQVAAETADFVRRFREIFPGAIVGSIEPIWANPRIEADDMRIWLDSYRAAAGEPFDFLYLDIAWPLWDNEDLGRVISEIETVADEREVPLGVIYIGDADSQTDGDWLQAAASRFTLVEETWGITPDHVPIMSWTDRPYRVLPENDPSAFTSLINQYFGDRTQVNSLEVVTTGEAPALTGSVSTTTGQPVVGAALQVEATPLSGVVIQTVGVSGVAPANADSAVIILRLNVETALVGDVQIVIHSVRYTDGNSDVNSVPNPEFDNGMQGWEAYGDPRGSAAVVASEVGNRRSMLLSATAEQVLFVDGPRFPITPGAEFEFEVNFSLMQDLVGRGSVAVVFLDTEEVGRATIPLSVRPVRTDTIVTDDAGAFTLPIRGLGSGEYEFRVLYPGDLEHWMSWALVVADIG